MTTDPQSEQFPTFSLAGIPFTAVDRTQAVAIVLSAVKNGTPVAYRLVNAWSLALATQDEPYADLLSRSGVNFMDGAPLAAYAKRRTRSKISPHVKGPRLFTDVIQAGVRHNVRHFLLGTTPQTLRKLTAELEHHYPGVLIAGTYSPPYAPIDELELTQQVETILAARAQLIWVATGTPRQDFLAERISRASKLPALAVGAAFDMEAGQVSKAPPWMTRLGVEWMQRLSQDPRRLWRRYLFGNLAFLRLLAKDLLRANRRRS